jgi:hypothetical protein
MERNWRRTLKFFETSASRYFKKQEPSTTGYKGKPIKRILGEVSRKPSRVFSNTIFFKMGKPILKKEEPVLSVENKTPISSYSLITLESLLLDTQKKIVLNYPMKLLFLSIWFRRN